jgi:hypothetical protein
MRSLVISRAALTMGGPGRAVSEISAGLAELVSSMFAEHSGVPAAGAGPAWCLMFAVIAGCARGAKFALVICRLVLRNKVKSCLAGQGGGAGQLSRLPELVEGETTTQPRAAVWISSASIMSPAHVGNKASS